MVLAGGVEMGMAVASSGSTTTDAQFDQSLEGSQGSTGVADTNNFQESDRIEIEATDNYTGGSENGDQAITMEVTFTAQEKTSGITIRFDNTQYSFIDYESFDVTVSNVEFNRSAPGVYNVQQLDAGESITFTFDAYPRALDRNNLNVVSVELDASNPQTYSQSTTLSADMSNSPIIDTGDGGDNGFSMLGPAGLIVGILGLAVAGYTRFMGGENVDETLEEVYDQLERKVSDRKALQTIRDTFNEYIDTEDTETKLP